MTELLEHVKGAVRAAKYSLTADDVQTVLDTLRDARRPPVSYVIETQSIRGEALADHVCLTLLWEMSVLSDDWTLVPLFGTALCVEKANVSNAALFLAVHDRQHCLLTRTPGKYTVEIFATCKYSSERNSGVTFDVPVASSSALRFIVPQKDVVFSIEPSVTFETIVDESTTTVTCSLRPERRVRIEWTRQTSEEREKKDHEEKVVTVNQNHLFSIGEGIFSSRSTLDYRIVHGSQSDFQIKIDRRVRVIEVLGEAISNWMLKQPEQTADVEIRYSVLQVWLNRAVEGEYQLTVVAEFDMESTSCQVDAPSFECVDVDKQRGHIGVEARTNVEIETLRMTGVAKIDVQELASSIQGAATRPLLHAFKFLTPAYALRLDVKKHSDVSVLIAVIEEAWLTMTVSEERVLTRCLLKMRNAQRQYLRVQLPFSDCEVWSTMVAGVAVKPSRDQNDKVLIPLQKSGEFMCEIVFLTRTPHLERKGSATVLLPRFDLPANQLHLSLYLPNNYKIGLVESESLNPVPAFSAIEPAAGEGDLRDSMPKRKNAQFFAQRDRAQPTQRQMMMRESQVMSNVMNVIDNDATEESLNLDEVGVLPVAVSTPAVGQLYRFERLLVISDTHSVRFSYRRHPTRPNCCVRCARAFGVGKLAALVVLGIALLIVFVRMHFLRLMSVN